MDNAAKTNAARTRRRETGAAPSQAALHEAALSHLARYAATEAGLRRVLDRRVDRWARAAAGGDPESVTQAAAEAKRAVRRVVARLVQTGVVDDAAYAAARAAGQLRSGRSRLAVAAGLAARGIGAETVAAVLPEDPERELAAALALARRRRLGPFRAASGEGAADAGTGGAETRRRELGVLARAGFAQATARRALAMPAAAAEALVVRLRRS
ncbi:MAG: RecX family transcriptional regulator [Acidisphaera sp.]|nr:RecX family transcriptional regulator [Acidisphaera sp.]